MTVENIIFIFLSIITIITSLGVIFSKSPIYSGLSLILTMISLSGHYVLLGAEFIAIINIIVYAGAVMVLLLFILMLLNLNKNDQYQKNKIYKIVSIFSVGGLLISLLSIFGISFTLQSSTNQNLTENFGYVQPLGQLLFSKYVLPFEISSILFLSAIVGIVFIGNQEKSKKRII